MPHDRTKAAATIRGRLRTLLGCQGSQADFDEIQAQARQFLGENDTVTLLVEAAGLMHASRCRPLDESVSAWATLRQRAQAHLPDNDQTLMAIRSHYARFLRLRGRPSDLDEVIDLRREEVRLRETQLAEGDIFVGIARSDLAVALIDRVRARVACHEGQRAGPDPDLVEAMHLIEEEIGRRSMVYAPANSFAQRSAVTRGELLVALAESSVGARRADYAGKSLAIADSLIDYFWKESQLSSSSILRCQLNRAESLTLLGRLEDGARAARQACAITAGWSRFTDRGRPLFVLAKAQRELDRELSLATASDALAARRKVFPADSYRVREVEFFLASA